MKHRVLDVGGRVEVRQSQLLARFWFHHAARVRCLPDGRILFAAEGVHLPVAETVVRLELLQLFVLNRTAPLPETPASVFPASQLEPVDVWLQFEVSPDSKQVLIEAFDEDSLLTLATGQVERFPQRLSVRSSCHRHHGGLRD